jgi:hypothetical protein
MVRTIWYTCTYLGIAIRTIARCCRRFFLVSKPASPPLLQHRPSSPPPPRGAPPWSSVATLMPRDLVVGPAPAPSVPDIRQLLDKRQRTHGDVARVFARGLALHLPAAKRRLVLCLFGAPVTSAALALILRSAAAAPTTTTTNNNNNSNPTAAATAAANAAAATAAATLLNASDLSRLSVQQLVLLLMAAERSSSGGGGGGSDGGAGSGTAAAGTTTAAAASASSSSSGDGAPPSFSVSVEALGSGAVLLPCLQVSRTSTVGEVKALLQARYLWLFCLFCVGLFFVARFRSSVGVWPARGG